MVAVWLAFAVMIYALEPLFVHERFRTRALNKPDGAFALARGLHAVALAVSMITIVGGVLGAHCALN